VRYPPPPRRDNRPAPPLCSLPMEDLANLNPPAVLDAIERDTAAIAFSMGVEPRTGALLRVLAASKPGGAMLELGTGTGLSTAWLLEGMDSRATLLTVDSDPKFSAVAVRHLEHDRRVTFIVEDAAAFLERMKDSQFDLIFADTWSGKFDHLENALALLRPGGLYVIDDLLPQPNWPDGHALKVPRLIDALEHDPRLKVSKLSWSSGILIAARIGGG
jgi:predicted O-methyltransferase YrrM